MMKILKSWDWRFMNFRPLSLYLNQSHLFQFSHLLLNLHLSSVWKETSVIINFPFSSWLIFVMCCWFKKGKLHVICLGEKERKEKTHKKTLQKFVIFQFFVFSLFLQKTNKFISCSSRLCFSTRKNF